MKKCRQCKSRFPDNFNFCPECGAPAPESPTFGGKLAQLGKGVLFVLLFTAIQYAAAIVFTFTLVLFAGFGLISADAYDYLNSNIVSLVSILAYAMTAVSVFIFYKARKKSVSENTGIKKFKASAIPFALLAGISLNYFVTFAMAVIPIPEALQERYDEIYSFLGEGNFIIEFISVAVLAPIIEELVFRGLCYRYARRSFPAFAAALISGAVFGIAHGNLISFVFTTVLGIVLAYAYEISGSIVPSMLIHIGFNAGSYILELTTAEMEDSAAVVLTLLAVSTVLSAVFCALLFKFSKKKAPAVPQTPCVDDAACIPPADADA